MLSSVRDLGFPKELLLPNSLLDLVHSTNPVECSLAKLHGTIQFKEIAAGMNPALRSNDLSMTGCVLIVCVMPISKENPLVVS